MITVLGASGNTGRAAAEKLLAAGERVRVVGRSPERLADLARRGAELAAGDAADPTFLASVFAGAGAAYALLPPDYAAPDPRADQRRLTAAIAEGARRAGVPRLVFLSSLGAELPAGTGPIAGLHEAEENLRDLDLDLVLLRAGYFYENFFGSLGLIRDHGVNGGAVEPEVPIVMVATADIGAAAAAELIAPATGGGVRVREVHGPRPLTLRAATSLLGEGIGRPDLAYVRFPDGDYASGLAAAGFSPAVAAAFVEMSAALSAGRIRSLVPAADIHVGTVAFEDFVPRLAAAYASR